MREFDAFEQLLQDSLRSDEQPSSSFTAAVMARVAQTPQRKPVSGRRVFRLVAGLAACIVVVCATTFPLWMRAGSAAPKATGSAAPAEAPMAAEAGAEEESVLTEAPTESNDSAAAEGSESYSDTSAKQDYGTVANGADQSMRVESAREPMFDTLDAKKEGMPTYLVSDSALCGQIRTWLESRGHKDDGGFVLHADEVSALNEAVPALGLPEGDCVLILAVS